MTGPAWGSRWRRRVAGLVALLATVVLAAGCQVNTQVAVDTTAQGTGTVEVTVTLDKAATQAVGDVKSQLQTADLTAAGWTVTGPSAGADGSTVVEASQAFSTPAQASELVAEIAGTGAEGNRPFRLSLTTDKTFWSTRTTLSGTADLTCNLACFGDSGLASELGTSTGVDPGSVAAQQKDFTFGVAVNLPGKLQSTDATSRAGGRLQWTPQLGSTTVLSATTTTRNVSHILVAVIGGAVVVGLLLLVIAVAILRRRASRRRARRRRQARTRYLQ